MRRRRITWWAAILFVAAVLVAFEMVLSCWYADTISHEGQARDVFVGVSFGQFYVTVLPAAGHTQFLGWHFHHTTLSPSLPNFWFDRSQFFYRSGNTFAVP